jgi:hypothetical protein
MELDRDAARELITATILAPGLRRATFGGAARGVRNPRWVRVVVRPVAIKGERRLQFSYFDAKKDTTRNFTLAEAAARLAELVAAAFAGVHLSTEDEEIDIRVTKRGKVLVGRRKANASPTALEPHNRVKDLPLPEGRADRLLEVMGIATAGGRVLPSMRGKFTQINEFLKQLRHALDAAELTNLGRPLEILDCGCGSSYLTLAAHHDLNDVLGIPANLLGVDVNVELIRKSIDKSGRVAAAGLSFACGRIAGVEARPDVVLALHACDTATDDAIAVAIRSEARLLLSVPCCHHALNRELNGEGASEVLRPLLRHGILRERTADLVTDAFRALALRIMGYRTDVVEFIATEHTARNLLIRAVRGLPAGDANHVAEYRALKAFWNLTPYIETALGKSFTELLGEVGL